MFDSPDQDPRVDPPELGGEAEVLSGFLRYQRATFELKCSGLSADQMARRAVEPSPLSLLGLLRHLADVERAWFRTVMAGADAPPHFWTDEDIDGDFDNAAADEEMVREAWARWREEVAFAERFFEEAGSLDTAGTHYRRGPVSLRWVVTHMIEEYARHNGHADLLREAIDGTVGE
ncbi:DinB family protein [Nocardiopsis sp. RSe5-2]|uniref:DinB family protein n=1 Tax=Nocardiopsis endophytica TaxID=3018445 RepID=A0ABT4UCM5_9ACTN|nr:DinB family protein [Nocardiopsis endophytica]MDA2814728.1 DinB family protein [Nocardiopsis endophytica]